MQPLISICIPAFKNEILLKRLLDSIQIQTFLNFEIIITDDSPDERLRILCGFYKKYFSLYYFWNQPSLGSPANWNYAISKAKGEWIKIMHSDDWFVSENSLNAFVEATQRNVNFIFSAYCNINLNNNLSKTIKLSTWDLSLLKNSPLNLFKKNFIGHPSTTLIKNLQNGIIYDESIKWVVDFDYYIRYLSKNNKFIYLDSPLINIGIHDDQVTKSSFRVKEVEIPENFYLLRKLGIKKLKNIFVYDYYWRLCRNLELRKPEDIIPYTNLTLVPAPILEMINFQSLIPKAVLKNGIFSKLAMSIAYTKNNLKSILKGIHF